MVIYYTSEQSLTPFTYQEKIVLGGTDKFNHITMKKKRNFVFQNKAKTKIEENTLKQQE
jgi:hypothetical protein